MTADSGSAGGSGAAFRAMDLVKGSGLPQHEAERLLIKASGLDRARLMVAGSLSGKAVELFGSLVERRRTGEPLQYLEGSVQFGPLELSTDERALIPRPETEQLWERVVASVDGTGPDVIVDLCTGSGNLALALKHEFPDADVYGTDISRDALALAAQNGADCGLDVQWCEGDLFNALPESLIDSVDLLVSNPPYVAAGDFDLLPADVRDHEPRAALVSGPEGSEVLMAIARAAGGWLRPGGTIACEINEFRAGEAQQMFRSFGGEVHRDLTGRARFVIGSRPAG